MKNKKLLPLLLVGIMFISMIAGCATSQQPASAPTAAAPGATTPEAAPGAAAPEAEPTFDGELKIGFVTYLSGTRRDLGDRFRCGAEIAVEKINAAGGVNGAKVVLELFDAGADQQSTINAVQLAVSKPDIAAILGVGYSTDNIAYSDIIRDAKIPLMCLGVSSGILAQKNPYMWMPRVSDVMTSRAFAKLCIDRGIVSPGQMWMTNGTGRSIYDEIVKYYEEQNLSMGLDLGFNVETETDYTPLVTQYLNSDCDGLIINGYSNAGTPEIVTLLHQYGYDMTKVGAALSAFSSEFTDIVGDKADGMFGISHYDPTSDRPGTKEYIGLFNAYQDKFTTGWEDVCYYDAVLLICEGAKLGGANDSESINKGLSLLKDYTGGALTDYTFHEDQSLGTTVYVAEIRGTDIVCIDTIAGR